MFKCDNLEQLQELLNMGLSTGGDFVEMFFESRISNRIEMTKGQITNSAMNNVYGVGVRILKESEEVYGNINETDYESLKTLILKLASSFKGEQTHFSKKLVDTSNNKIVKIKRTLLDVDNEEKIKYLKQANDGALSNGSEIVQVISTLLEWDQNVLVVNSEGKYAKDRRHNIRLFVEAIASNGQESQMANRNIGKNIGYEFFENIDFYKLGQDAGKSAITILHADEITGGKMTVVVSNGFGGVLLHEACVHSLEATSVAKGASVFCNKLGQKIASDIVTAVDDGTLQNNWGSTNIDDEGNETQRNVLIENGILKKYLVDYRNSRIMNHPITGSGRRQSYKYSPTSRMTNTFFEKGKSTVAEIIAATEKGLFAKAMGGGSVDPTTGEFNFAVNEGYLIENGKITKPVKGATLVGSGSEVLLNIDMIADDLVTAQGMCGSLSGSVPTEVGQPTIRVLNMTVGGRG